MNGLLVLILAVGAFYASAQSLDGIGGLPQCGQVCIQNMLAKASEFNCQPTDVACLCRSRDFTYGIRDCSLESCSNGADQVIEYGISFCRDQGVVVTTIDTDPQATASNGVADSPAATSTSAPTEGGASSQDSDAATATTTTEQANQPTDATETTSTDEGEENPATATDEPSNHGERVAPVWFLAAAYLAVMLF